MITIEKNCLFSVSCRNIVLITSFFHFYFTDPMGAFVDPFVLCFVGFFLFVLSLFYALFSWLFSLCLMAIL